MSPAFFRASCDGSQAEDNLVTFQNTVEKWLKMNSYTSSGYTQWSWDVGIHKTIFLIDFVADVIHN